MAASGEALLAAEGVIRAIAPWSPDGKPQKTELKIALVRVAKQHNLFGAEGVDKWADKKVTELIESHNNDVELSYVHQFLADEDIPHLPPGGGLASK